MAGLDGSLGVFQEVVERISEAVGPRVVRVGGAWRGGSGLVMGDGTVLTNAHNVRGEEVRVAFADGRSTGGTLTGADVEGDIAVIRADTTGIEGLSWPAASEASVGLGAPVFAVTTTSQGSRVTFGLVSSVSRSFRGPRGRRISGSIEHTAPMAPGSSGSPLVDAEGRLVGVNTHRAGSGFYLALPADRSLRDRVDALARGETPVRPRLGIGVAPDHVSRGMRRAVGLPERDGLLVREVESEAPAARAGITEGDLLVSAGGRPLATVDDLHDALASNPASGTIEIVVVRGAEERTVSVEIGSGAG